MISGAVVNSGPHYIFSRNSGLGLCGKSLLKLKADTFYDAFSPGPLVTVATVREGRAD